MWKLKTPTARYSLAVASVGCAFLLTHLMWSVMEGNIALLFITAVMISALCGGLGPGLLASLLGTAVVAFSFLPPRYSFDLSYDDLLRLVMFVATAFLVSWLSSSRRRWEEALRESHDVMERRVRDRTAELTESNRELEAEIGERKKAEARTLAYQSRLQSLAVELSTTEERQRRRIASTLHDAVGHRLAVAVIKLRELLTDDAVPNAAELTRICDLVEQSIEYTRSLTLQLSPPILYELGLEPAVEWLAERVQHETGLVVTVEDDGQAKTLDDDVRPLLFSSIRELLVNVVKHAQAHSVRVAMSRNDDRIHVVVTDDGVGCECVTRQVGSAALSGFGLFNIRERLASVGGQFEMESLAGDTDIDGGSGCRVTLVAPLCVTRAQTPETVQS